MSLTTYNKKRNFKQTKEPKGAKAKATGKLKFVIQRHAATRLHFDFRLEMDGVLKSWAVPKGPSLNPSDKRLAMMVEDHPYSYRTFEGEIPKGNYGAGMVEIWDEGTYEILENESRLSDEKKLLKDLKAGSIKIIMHGKKLKGEFALVKIKKNKEQNAWLLIKHKDNYAVTSKYDANKFVNKTSKVTKALNEKRKKQTAKSKITEPALKVNKYAASLKLTNEKKITDFVKPMLAGITNNKPFDNDEWIFEIKWDGYRAIADTGKVTPLLYSRNGLSFANKYETIFNELKKIKTKAILDGEIVVLDENGKPNFQLLQHYAENPQYPIVYYVFDVLKINNKDTTHLTLIERKELLQKLLPENNYIKFCDHIDAKGVAFFKQAVKANLEGIIAKRKESTYAKNTRSKEWLKIKNQNTEEVVIAGYTAPRASRKYFGALILGRHEKGKLKYAGHTGTGFDDISLENLHTQLQSLVQKECPFETVPKTNAKATWVKPELICNIKFTELTKDKIFRHPVFMGLREDKKAKEVTITDNEKIKIKRAKTKTVQVKKTSNNNTDTTKIINKYEVKLTNQNKIYWPDEGYTKADVINYYQQMSKYIIPHLKDRPQSLNRFPNGIKGSSFYHKDAGGNAPEWVKSTEVFSESNNKNIDYIICNDAATLAYLNNLGCIEMNPWNSRTTRLDNPDYLVIDLDPSEKNTFKQVVDAALATKKILDIAKAKSYCKTSGSTGLHIYVPLGAKYDYDAVRNFAHLIAMKVTELLPDTTTLERNLKKRGKDKIYIDYLQNRTGQTLASVYSLRPKPGATASTPLEWKEVNHRLDISKFNINTLYKRVAAKGDIFKPVLGKGINMMQCIKNLEKHFTE